MIFEGIFKDYISSRQFISTGVQVSFDRLYLRTQYSDCSTGRPPKIKMKSPSAPIPNPVDSIITSDNPYSPFSYLHRLGAALTA